MDNEKELDEFAARYVKEILTEFNKKFPGVVLADFSYAAGLVAQNLMATVASTIITNGSREMAKDFLEATLGDLDEKINTCVRKRGTECSVKVKVELKDVPKPSADPDKGPSDLWSQRFSFGGDE